MSASAASAAGAPAGARIVLATRNQGKVREFRALLAGSPELAGTDLEEAVTDAETAGCSEIPETGVTFEENALIKARAVAEQTGLPAVADDSGLAVEVLGGAPGIFSARWAGRQASDAANLQLLLDQLADISEEHRAAAFVCAAALVVPGGPGRQPQEVTTSGRLEGTLLPAPRGEGGFGYDPIVQPAGESRSTAELSMEEKNAISHRGKAFAQLREHVVRVLA